MFCCTNNLDSSRMLNQQFTAAKADQQLLLYLGYKPDASVPWGGYHITVIGRSPYSTANLNLLKNILQKNKWSSLTITPNNSELVVDEPSSSSKNSFRGKIVVRSQQLDEFADVFKNHPQFRIKKPKFGNSQWHISLYNCTDEAEATRLYEQFTGKPFRFYIVTGSKAGPQWECFPLFK